MTRPFATGLPGGHSEWEPPDPFSNSEVKTLCADASVDFVDVKVGHCQALDLMKMKPSPMKVGEGFFMARPAGHSERPVAYAGAGQVADIARGATDGGHAAIG